MKTVSAFAWLLATGAVVVHACLQFVAWGMSSSNAGIVWIWQVLSFPVFAVTPTNFATVNFWFVFGANSVVWGLVVWVTVYSILRSKNRPRYH